MAFETTTHDRIQIPEGATSVAFSSDVSAAILGGKILLVWDREGRSHMEGVGTLFPPQMPDVTLYDVAVHGRFVYVATGSYGLYPFYFGSGGSLLERAYLAEGADGPGSGQSHSFLELSLGVVEGFAFNGVHFSSEEERSVLFEAISDGLRENPDQPVLIRFPPFQAEDATHDQISWLWNREGPMRPVYGVEFSSDGTTLFAASSHWVLKINRGDRVPQDLGFRDSHAEMGTAQEPRIVDRRFIPFARSISLNEERGQLLIMTTDQTIRLMRSQDFTPLGMVVREPYAKNGFWVDGFYAPGLDRYMVLTSSSEMLVASPHELEVAAAQTSRQILHDILQGSPDVGGVNGANVQSVIKGILGNLGHPPAYREVMLSRAQGEISETDFQKAVGSLKYGEAFGQVLTVGVLAKLLVSSGVRLGLPVVSKGALDGFMVQGLRRAAPLAVAFATTGAAIQFRAEVLAAGYGFDLFHPQREWLSVVNWTNVACNFAGGIGLGLIVGLRLPMVVRSAMGAAFAASGATMSNLLNPNQARWHEVPAYAMFGLTMPLLGLGQNGTRLLVGGVGRAAAQRSLGTAALAPRGQAMIALSGFTAGAVGWYAWAERSAYGFAKYAYPYFIVPMGGFFQGMKDRRGQESSIHVESQEAQLVQTLAMDVNPSLQTKTGEPVAIPSLFGH